MALPRDSRGPGPPVGAPPLLLWCDPDRSWLDLLHEAAKADGFELWAPPSARTTFTSCWCAIGFFPRRALPASSGLPCSRDAISWFKAFELEAEEVWEKSLLQALREYGVDISREHEDELVGLLPAHAREWFDKPKETWKELTPGNAKGTLVDDHRMLQVLAGPPGEFDRSAGGGSIRHFRHGGRPRTLDCPILAAWKRTTGGSPPPLACFAPTRPRECPRSRRASRRRSFRPVWRGHHALKLLEQWQHDIRYVANFERLVPQAEATVGLGHWARNLTTMPRSWSSRAVEEGLFMQRADRLDRLEDVDMLADELERDIQTYNDRESGFWGKDADNPRGLAVSGRSWGTSHRTSARIVRPRKLEEAVRRDRMVFRPGMATRPCGRAVVQGIGRLSQAVASAFAHACGADICERWTGSAGSFPSFWRNRRR